jgi:hypothetical protein
MNEDRDTITLKKGVVRGRDGKSSLNELSWISNHNDLVAPHQGKWIALKVPDGIVASSASLEKVILEWKKRYPGETPFVFMVPRKNEGAFVR